MRVVVKVSGIFIALLVIIAAIPAFIPDEEYLPGVEQWLKDANTHEDLPIEVNRFNALVGFSVAADKDMVVEGAKLVAEVNAVFDAVMNNSEVVGFNDYWDNPPLTAKGRLSSNTTTAFEGDPAQWLTDNHEDYLELVSGNPVLLDRFRKLMTMKQYSYTMKLDVNAPFVSYNNFLALKRLDNLSIIDEFSMGNKQSAIQRLQEGIAFSKLMMKQSVILIDKMIANALLKADLLTYSSLLDLSPANAASELKITNLQEDERGMLNVVRGEFAYMSPSLDFESARRLDNGTAETDMLEELVIKYYFKRNKMENNAYTNIWQPFLKLDELSLASRESKVITGVGENGLTWWQIYQDPIGYIYSAIAVPSYGGYINKMDHVDATITLLNLKASIYSNNVTADNVENTIFSANATMNAGYAGAKFSWDKDSQELSFDIPDYTDEDIPRIKLYFNRKS